MSRELRSVEGPPGKTVKSPHPSPLDSKERQSDVEHQC